MLSIGDRVKIGDAKYKSDLCNNLNRGRTGVITDRRYWLTGAVAYTVRLDEPYSYLGYQICEVGYDEIDNALQKIPLHEQEAK